MQVENVKKQVSVADVLAMYGFEVKKRIPCPIHGGVKNNFAVGDDYFKCFSCGEGGDIFKLVQALSNVNFMEAKELICQYFNLVSSSGEKTQPVKQEHRKKHSLKKVRDYQERRICHTLRNIRISGGNDFLEQHLEGLLDRFRQHSEFYVRHDIHAHLQAILCKNIKSEG